MPMSSKDIYLLRTISSIRGSRYRNLCLLHSSLGQYRHHLRCYLNLLGYSQLRILFLPFEWSRSLSFAHFITLYKEMIHNHVHYYH